MTSHWFGSDVLLGRLVCCTCASGRVRLCLSSVCLAFRSFCPPPGVCFCIFLILVKSTKQFPSTNSRRGLASFWQHDVVRFSCFSLLFLLLTSRPVVCLRVSLAPVISSLSSSPGRDAFPWVTLYPLSLSLSLRLFSVRRLPPSLSVSFFLLLVCRVVVVVLIRW